MYSYGILFIPSRDRAVFNNHTAAEGKVTDYDLQHHYQTQKSILPSFIRLYRVRIQFYVRSPAILCPKHRVAELAHTRRDGRSQRGVCAGSFEGHDHSP